MPDSATFTPISYAPHSAAMPDRHTLVVTRTIVVHDVATALEGVDLVDPERFDLQGSIDTTGFLAAPHAIATIETQRNVANYLAAHV